VKSGQLCLPTRSFPRLAVHNWRRQLPYPEMFGVLKISLPTNICNTSCSLLLELWKFSSFDSTTCTNFYNTAISSGQTLGLLYSCLHFYVSLFHVPLPIIRSCTLKFSCDGSQQACQTGQLGASLCVVWQEQMEKQRLIMQFPRTEHCKCLPPLPTDKGSSRNVVFLFQ
jgi:hypothetical protein